MLKKMYKNIVYENAVIIAINLADSNHDSLIEELNELTLLSDTAGFKIADTIIQARYKIDSATFIGKGKIKSAINNAKELNVSVMIFNDDLSPAQLKNIQKQVIKLKLLSWQQVYMLEDLIRIKILHGTK